MQELRLVLIVVGVLAITALLIHGLWTNRKEQPAKFGEKPHKKMSDMDDQGFDQDGIGEVRVVAETQARQEPEFSFGETLSNDPLMDATPSQPSQNDASIPTREAQYGSHRVESEPIATQPRANEQGRQEAIEPTLSFSASDDDLQGDRVTSTAAPTASPAPTAAEPVETLANEEVVRTGEQTIAVEPVDIVEEVPEPEPEVLVLHVHATQGEVFKGARLINTMEQNGLSFGDMNIYHRHSDDMASSKVIFSVANIVKPGVFHQGVDFETPGISFFMTLPCYGNAESNFNLMLQTAQQIADDLSGLVMDEQRQMITPQKLDTYREKIKRFQTS